MKTHALKTLACLTLFALLAGPAIAAEVNGVILDTKEVQVKDKDVQNKVLLLKTGNERIIVADMGPAKDLEDVALEKDKQIKLEGDSVRVGNRPVFLVSKANIEGREIKVKRGETPEVSKKGTDIKNVKGQIINEKNVDIKGQDQTHKVVMLETEKGNHIVADLGPGENLNDLKVQKGKEIEVQGRITRVSDHLVVIADKVQADDKTVEIERKKVGQEKS